MVSITLSVPPELKQEMDKFPEINWSAVARQAIRKRIEMMEKFMEFARDSEMTEEDSLRPGRELNRKFSKKYKV